MAALFANGVAYAAEPLGKTVSAETLQQELNKRGVGRNVKIIRTDGSEAKGRIVAIGADAVTIQANNVALWSRLPMEMLRR